MKYYRHTMTMREELTRKQRLERIQAGYEFLLVLFVVLAITFISVMVLA